MKTITAVLCALLLSFTVVGQKVEYDDGLIKVDGKDLAKVVKIKDKESMGLTSTFEVMSMGGVKLIIATVANDVDADPNNTADYFYRVTFLTADQIGIFNVSKMGAEKSFAKLIGKAGIIVDDKLDANLVKEFIAKKGKTPKVSIDYTLVNRQKNWPINLKTDKTIEQNSKIIGSFADKTVQGKGMDSYEFYLPSGVLIAKVSFTGGNNAQNCEMLTLKDNSKRFVPIPSKDKIEWSSSSIDRNQWALERIVKWLMENQYI